MCAGLAVVVLGTFLPWLRSGSVTRNSYASDRALRDLWHVHGPLAALLSVWPFVSLACALGMALLLLGLARAGSVVAVLAALCAAGVAAWTLATSGNTAISPATAGPAVTLAGAVLTCAFLFTQFVSPDRRTLR